MNKLIAIIGQLFIIFGLVSTICVVIREIRHKPRSFWYIFINRLRYINYIGWRTYIKSWFQKQDFPDHPYNYSYLWLCENKIHMLYYPFVIATLDLIYQMINQISTGYIYTKPHAFYIFSPIRSICTACIIAFLINEARAWKIKYINEMKNSGKVIDKFDKITDDTI